MLGNGKSPLVVTGNGSAADCRPRQAKLTLKYKHAKTTSEAQEAGDDYIQRCAEKPYLQITEWGVSDIEHDAQWLGLSGSPTKVKQIESVVFAAKESMRLTPSDSDMDGLMKQLIANHTIG